MEEYRRRLSPTGVWTYFAGGLQQLHEGEVLGTADGNAQRECKRKAERTSDSHLRHCYFAFSPTVGAGVELSWAEYIAGNFR